MSENADHNQEDSRKNSLEEITSREVEVYRQYFKLMGFKGKAETRTPREVDLEVLAKYYESFLIDGYGSLYIDNQVFPMAPESIEYLRSKGKNIRLLTNSASKSPQDMQTDFRDMGFEFLTSEILSSGMLLKFLNEKMKIKDALYLGRESGIYYLEQAGIKPVGNPESKVVIFSTLTEVEPVMLERATQILAQKDALMLVLNPDVCAPIVNKEPGERRLVHGDIAWKMHEMTRSKVLFVGKPFPLSYIRAMHSLIPSTGPIVMIGDTLGTDVAGAEAQGLDSALILRGNTSRDEIGELEYQLQVKPTYYLNDLRPPDQ